jgi:hypothetical protein
MGLFDQIINAIDNSKQEASSGQMATILSTMQQLSDSYGAEPSTVQSVLSVVGNYVRAALQQKRSTDGYEEAQAVVNQYSGTYPNPQAIHTLFSPNQEQQLAQDAAQRTGLNAGTIQAMLPILVPLVLNLLQTGTRVQNPQGGSNPVLNTFLDADRDGDVDIADAMQMAGRYLSR